MKIPKAKHYSRIDRGEKIPRWAKKAILGIKTSATKLRRKIKSYKPEDGHFCPSCGCAATRSTGNMASYPERWVNIYCLRCGLLVEVSDNSPYVHILDCGGVERLCLNLKRSHRKLIRLSRRLLTFFG